MDITVTYYSVDLTGPQAGMRTSGNYLVVDICKCPAVATFAASIVAMASDATGSLKTCGAMPPWIGKCGRRR